MAESGVSRVRRDCVEFIRKSDYWKSKGPDLVFEVEEGRNVTFSMDEGIDEGSGLRFDGEERDLSYEDERFDGALDAIAEDIEGELFGNVLGAFEGGDFVSISEIIAGIFDDRANIVVNHRVEFSDEKLSLVDICVKNRNHRNVEGVAKALIDCGDGVLAGEMTKGGILVAFRDGIRQVDGESSKLGRFLLRQRSPNDAVVGANAEEASGKGGDKCIVS